MKLSRGTLAVIIIAVVIILDQALKIWVKTSFYWGESLELLPFFELRFVQNPGMAFGWQLGSKLFLTVFRIIAVIALFIYVAKIRKLKLLPLGYLVCVAMVTAGAMGNIFDCVFYGEIFNNPYPPGVASFVHWGDGYASLFHGMVVDMLYFPLFSFTWPQWIPWVGGTVFSFFDPVFNLADASISVGMIVLIVFYHKYILVTSDEQIKSITGKKED